jgi:hypothetical protein
MTQFDPVLDERMLERERAAERKADEIVAPHMRDLFRLFDQFAATPDAVAWQVGANVEILAKARQARVARLGNRENRTRLRVRLGETQEVMGERARQNYEICLDVTRRQPRRRPGEVSRANTQSLAPAGFDTSIRP